MIVQIFGTKKCKNTRKAERFFKERRIQSHNVNLLEKGLSPGELRSVAQSVGGLDNMLDKNGKAWEALGLKYKQFDPEKLILEHPEVLKTPIVRNGKSAAVGYQPETWKSWVPT